MQQFPLEHSAAIDTTPDVNPLKQIFYVPSGLNCAFLHTECTACVCFLSFWQ